MSLCIVRNDITKMNTEAIVNTANSRLEVGDGCDRAIYRAAGYDELLAYRKEHIGEREEGEAFITPGFALEAKYIIHVVSPLYTGGNDGEESKLRKCYLNALELACAQGITSIAVPLIATGSYGYPKADALRIAMEEINAFLINHNMDVKLVVFDSDSTEMVRRITPFLESYIDQNYVDINCEMEYAATETDRLEARRPFSRFASNALAFGSQPRAARNKSSRAGNAAMEKAELCEAAEISAYEELEDSPKLRERLLHIQDSFGEYLFYLIESKEMSSSQVQNGAWITKQVYSKINTNRLGYKPSKRVAMQLCIGLNLNIDESIDLLARAGFAFSPSDKQDLIFRFFIENKCYDILGVSDALEKYGLEPIIGF